jgi:hypothetical protein
MLVAWPAAFFLVTGYSEALALALLAWAFVAVRRERFLVAGMLAAALWLTKYYDILLVAALAYEVWGARGSAGRWSLVRRLGLVVVPSVAAVGVWMAYCAHRFHDAFAFAHAQAAWNRTFAWPWHLAWRTVLDLIHLRFLDTSVASVVELFDAVTVVALAAVAVYSFVRVRRSYGLLLVLALAVYSFETILVGETREVTTLFPFFLVLGLWAERHRWLERMAYAAFLPCAYFLIERFVTLRFAG